MKKMSLFLSFCFFPLSVSAEALQYDLADIPDINALYGLNGEPTFRRDGVPRRLRTAAPRAGAASVPPYISAPYAEEVSFTFAQYNLDADWKIGAAALQQSPSGFSINSGSRPGRSDTLDASVGGSDMTRALMTVEYGGTEQLADFQSRLSPRRNVRERTGAPEPATLLLLASGILTGLISSRSRIKRSSGRRRRRS